jgi:hypothetical protein
MHELCLSIGVLIVPKNVITEKKQMVPTIITGASSNHFLSLKQLLNSVKSFCSDARLVVWDLGLTEAERRYLEELFGLTLNVFDYSQYPAHYDITIGAGQYAWKPSLIKETTEMYGDGIYLWLDAGDLVIQKMDTVFDYVSRYGIYSNTTGLIKSMTHSGVYAKIDKRFSRWEGKAMRNGAVIGFDYSRKWIKELIDTWNSWALENEIIAPSGSDRSNHRQDQSLLSLLFWDYHSRLGFDTEREFGRYIKTQQDIG